MWTTENWGVLLPSPRPLQAGAWDAFWGGGFHRWWGWLFLQWKPKSAVLTLPRSLLGNMPFSPHRLWSSQQSHIRCTIPFQHRKRKSRVRSEVLCETVSSSAEPTAIYLLTVLEAEGPRSRRRQGWFLLQPLSLACKSLSSHCVFTGSVSAHTHLGSVRVPTFPSLRTPVRLDEGPP